MDLFTALDIFHFYFFPDFVANTFDIPDFVSNALNFLDTLDVVEFFNKIILVYIFRWSLSA